MLNVPTPLARFRQSRLAQVISLVLASAFSLRVVEAEAEDSVVAPEIDDLNLPSEAGAMQDPPSYVDIALTAAHEAPRVFATRALLGAPPPITVSTTGGVGIAASTTSSDQVINLAAANTVGTRAGTAASITLERDTVRTTAITAATANGQTGLHARDGGSIIANDSNVLLDPKTGTGVAITANDLTGVLVETGSTANLSNTNVLVTGGAKGNNNRGAVAAGAGSSLAISGGSVSTSSWGAIGVSVENGASAKLSHGLNVTTSGARSTTTAGAHGLRVTGNGSTLSGDDIHVTTSNSSAYGVRVDNGGHASLSASQVDTAGGNGHGVLADGTGSRVAIQDSEITTTGKGSVGVWARNGAHVQLEAGTTVNTSGAAVSTASPVDDEKVLSLSHGLLASGAGTQLQANDTTLQISAGSASAARAEDGAHIGLDGGTVSVTGSATTTTTTAALHALNGGQIEADRLALSSTGTNVGGTRAEGVGSSVAVRDSNLRVDGAGSVANPAAGARAMGGGQVSVERSIVNVHGLTYGHGVSAEGSGSQASVVDSTVSVDGNRSIGVNITGGAAGDLRGSVISVDAPAGAVGPWSPGVLVEGAGSTLQMSATDVHTTPKTSYGVQVSKGADANLSNGRITTTGNYSAALAAGSSTVTASNMTIETSGNDNAMGIVADTGATIIVHGGSVTTNGNGSPVPGNLTFPHGLAARNPGALLIADGTSVLTRGSQAYGAAVDDGGSMVLDNVTVKTEGEYSNGLYAGIGGAKPGNVSLSASHVTVDTLGDHASGAVVSRQYKNETATLDLTDASISTHGAESHGLRAESGAALTAGNTVVATHGDQSLGVLANNTSTVSLDTVGVATDGAFGHGVVAKNGGSIDGSGVVVQAHGEQAAALYAQGTDAQPATVDLTSASLSNRSGATIATAGVADISLSQAIVGGSGQWLNVDRSVASDGTTLPDMGTGQWQGIGQSYDSAGQARIDLSGSVVTGSAHTADGSTASVSMQDTSIWRLTDNSNLTTLDNSASLIDFSAPVAGSFKSLTLRDYHGDNGTVALNTYLDTDGSPSDQIVIDGGAASGSTNLQIRNAGGPGALTHGNGIQVVDARNGGTSETGAFRLLSRVKAGPYEYTLHRSSLDDSNQQAWYLRSTTDVPIDPRKPDDPDPVPQQPGDPQQPDPAQPTRPTPAPATREVPNYRAETSLYSAVPAMALHYSRAMVDTLHERVGEERRMATDPLPEESIDTYGPSLGWGRLIYRKGQDSLPGGADYDYNIQAFQVGVDLYRNEDTDGSTDQAGLSLQTGRIKGSVDHTDGRDAGDDLLRSYGLGGYWTHFGPEGWYLDGVLQLNRFDIKASGNDGDSLKTRGHGVTASLEAGYPFKVNKDKTLHVEPQAQLIVSKLKIDDSHDDAADVRFEDVDSLTGRLGVRIDKDWFREDDNGKIHRTNGWIRPSVWHEFKGKAKTEFSSANGYIPFGTDMSGTWGELNVGVDYQINDRTTLTGSLGYQKAFGDDGRSYEGILGVKVKF